MNVPRTYICYAVLSLLLLLPGCVRTPAAADTASTDYVSEVQDPRAKALYHFGHARLAMADENWQEAAEALKRALAEDPDSAESHLALAQVQLELGQLDDAQKSLEEALRLQPDLLQAHLTLGQLLIRKGDNAGALIHLGRAVELNPDDEQMVMQLAIAYIRSNQPAAGQHLLESFLKQHPDSLAAKYALARLYRQLGHAKKSEALYRQVLAERPDLQPAVLELSGLLVEQGRVSAAKDLLETAAERNPEDSAYRHQLVQLLLREKRLDEARNELEKLLQQNPDDEEARRKLGLIDLQQNNWVAAEDVLRPLVESGDADENILYYYGTALTQLESYSKALDIFERIGPESRLYPDAVAHRSALLRKLGRSEEAVKVLNEALKQPDVQQRMELYLYLAGILQELHQPESALQVLQRGWKAYPTNTRFPYQIGMIQDAMGRKDAAAATMKQVLALDANNADALNYLAYSWAEQGINLQQALEYIQRALERKRPAYMLDTLGWVYFKLGRYADARTQLEAAIKGLGQDPLVLEHLGDTYRALGLKDKALKIYRSILQQQEASNREAVQRKVDELEQGR